MPVIELKNVNVTGLLADISLKFRGVSDCAVATAIVTIDSILLGPPIQLTLSLFFEFRYRIDGRIDFLFHHLKKTCP